MGGKDAWLAWVDDLPLPDTFQDAQNGLQEYITAQAAEIARLREALTYVIALDRLGGGCASIARAALESRP